MVKAAYFLLMVLASVCAFPTAKAAEIGVVLAGMHMTFWQTMTEGIRRAGKDLDVDVIIRSPVDGAAVKAQPNIQLRMIEYMMKRQVAGIVLAPEPLKGGEETPISLPVPLVLVDRDNKDFDGLSLIATDNFAAGRVAARSLETVLSPGAKVAVLRLAPNISSTTDREEGFLSVAREAGWNVVVDTYVGFDAREALERSARLLREFPGKLDAVFAPNETTAYGALRVVSAMPAERRPRLVAFDWRREFEEALKSGVLHATIVQDPYGMGYQAVEILAAAIQGTQPPSKVAVDVVAVTEDNMNEAAVQSILSRYGGY